MLRRAWIVWVVGLALLLGATSEAEAKRKGKKKAEEAAETVDPAVDKSRLKALRWREVGPYRGGRSAAATGIPGDPLTYYFGATGGGVWKTTDAGVSWKNVSDGFFGSSIGAVAVSEWDPNVVYVGGGEKTVRGNVSHGDGVWKSTDAGKSWKHIGLGDTRHVPRIRIHPKNPDLVYVAALGHLFGPNEERGVFRSSDGGESWEKILYVNEHAGAVDLVMDPTNPRVLYASFWRVLRTPYSLESGGEGSGLWKSTDGGDNWKEITGNGGLPKGTIGISGISVSASNPDNVYAIIEAEEGGVFRSRNGGQSWTRVNEERKLRQRAWYYTRIVADPGDEDSVYVLNVRFHHSKDGGKSFRSIAVPHGDNHDLWIAPEDPMRMVQTNDGGANVSFDGGATWSRQDNQPTAQMYRVSVDNDFPYRLLGGQQDNSAVRIRNRGASGGRVTLRDWEPTAGGESGHIVAKPDDPDIVYGGSYGGFLVRVNHRTGERRAVNVWPDNPMGWGAADLKYRFQWNFPLFFSPHNPDRLYAAANVLFVSEDEGASWTAISPDLTRDDKSKQGASGGPITKDNTGVEYYCTIFAALESPHEEGVLWAGSDDGLIHVSRDGGENWTNVTPPMMPEWAMINGIDAHPFEPGGLYVAATRYKLDDFKPYLYKTTDYGQSWTEISNGIDPEHFTRAIRADPARRGLLYAGTEREVYVSFDDGAHWQSLQLNLPEVPITDLAVKEDDLIAATQGRGYWLIDDLSPLQQLEVEPEEDAHRLYSPRPAYRMPGGRGFGGSGSGGAPPSGALVYYHLADSFEDSTPVKLEILDEGVVVRSYSCKDKNAKPRTPGSPPPIKEDLAQLPCGKGLNRFAWDLSYPGPEGFEGMILWNGGMSGPTAVPGQYMVRLTIGEGEEQWRETVPLELRADPRSSATPADYRAQFDFVREGAELLAETHREIGRIRDARSQIDAVESRIEGLDGADEVLTKATEIRDRLETIEKALYQTRNQSRQDPLNFPIRLNDKLAGVVGLTSFGNNAPTRQAVEVKDALSAQIRQQLEALSEVWADELPQLNAMVRELELPAVALGDASATGD